MDHSWRARPQTGNLCPVCSNSHFPFCPPPIAQIFRPPPPPSHHSDQFFNPHPPPFSPLYPPYDPLVDHHGVALTSQHTLPLRPCNNDSNFSPNLYGNLRPRSDYDNGHMMGAKRMRIDNSSLSWRPKPFMNDNYVSLFGEDERRLKLIRDHGAVSNGLHRNYDSGSNFSANSFEKSSFGEYFHGIESGNNQENNTYKRQTHDTQLDYWNQQNTKNVELIQFPYDQGESKLMLNHSNVTDDYRNMNQAPVCDTLKNSEERSQFPRENRFSLPYATQHQALVPGKVYSGSSISNKNVDKVQNLQGYNGQPPLPTSPPPPPPPVPALGQVVSSSVSGDRSLLQFSAKPASCPQSSHAMVSKDICSAANSKSSKPNMISSVDYTEIPRQEIQAFPMTQSKMHLRGSEEVLSYHRMTHESKVVDASHILKKPHRATRPDHIVVIMRGLPGSGKSYLAKMLRDIEVENGGSAPRIHSMDDYFMIEVEKVEKNEGSKSTSSVRGKITVMKKVMEYCYEPEMEEAYRSSMLKAFKKTLDEGVFSFVIVDDRNLRVADFSQFWATAKRSGYEVYLLEAAYKDPAGCAARNVHGFTLHDIQKMANQWENAPCLYMKLDSKSLIHGDELEENGIQEVDMDTEDGDHNGETSGSKDANVENIIHPSKGPKISERKWDAVVQCPIEVVKDLENSKWSNDLDEDDVKKANTPRVNFSVLSGLAKSYSKLGKSVYWADQVSSIGFSIGSGRTTNVSLVIGPGSGYNLKSNPLPEKEKLAQKTGGSKRPYIFQEQLRAEHEAFRAVFDKRRHRIGLDLDEE